MPNYKQVGEAISLPYCGEIFTASDGSIYKLASGKTFPYSSTYSDLLTDAPGMITSAVNMNGPYSGFWDTTISQRQIIGPAVGTWLLLSVNTTNYYTSTDSGNTWTVRTLPFVGKTFVGMFDGTNYILIAHNTTTSGIYESTDGINWTARNNPSVFNTRAIHYLNGLYIALPTTGTGYITSTDRITWTARTLATGTSQGNYIINTSTISWNAGAGLYIASTIGNDPTYQTSTDGINWTIRTINELASGQNLCIASNSTTTVMIGACGIGFISTDGINWTRIKLPDPTTLLASPNGVFWDGTYFVAVYIGVRLYSTNGTDWNISTRGGLGSVVAGTIIKTPTGILSPNGGYALHLTDPASTANTNIITPVFATISSVATYYCILSSATSSGGLTPSQNDSLNAIKAKTDQLVFSSGNVNAIAQVVADKTGYALTAGERTAIAVAVESALLNDGDGQQLLNAIISSIQSIFDNNADVPVSTIVSAIVAQIERTGGMLDAVPTLSEITTSSLAKTTDVTSAQSAIIAQVNTKPTLAQIEASTVLAKEASVDAIPTNPLLTTDVRLDNLDAPISGVSGGGGGGGGGLTTDERERLFQTATRGDVSFSPSFSFEEKQKLFEIVKSLAKEKAPVVDTSLFTKALAQINTTISGLAKKEDLQVTLENTPDERIPNLIQTIETFMSKEDDTDMKEIRGALTELRNRKLDVEAIDSLYRQIQNMPTKHIEEVKNAFMEKIHESLSKIMAEEILKQFVKEGVGALFEKTLRSDSKNKLFEKWASKQ